MPPASVTLSMSQKAPGRADCSTDKGDKDSSVCPTCGKQLKSKKGMYQHHKRTHGESIAKADVDCDECGESHSRWRSQMDGGPYYCSQSCRLSGLQTLHQNGANRKRVTISCGHCGKETERRPSRLERSDTLYCSRECANNDHSDRVSGEGNPRWLGGLDAGNRYYGPNWNEQQRRARERDSHTCQRCGKHRSEMGHEMPVHHKTRFEEFDDYREANALENLICLCRSCHGKVESWPVQPM